MLQEKRELIFDFGWDFGAAFALATGGLDLAAGLNRAIAFAAPAFRLRAAFAAFDAVGFALLPPLELMPSNARAACTWSYGASGVQAPPQ